MKRKYLLLLSLIAVPLLFSCAGTSQDIKTIEQCEFHVQSAQRSDQAAQKVSLPEQCTGCTDSASCQTRLNDIEQKLTQNSTDQSNVKDGTSDYNQQVAKFTTIADGLNKCKTAITSIKQHIDEAQTSRGLYKTCRAGFGVKD